MESSTDTETHFVSMTKGVDDKPNLTEVVHASDGEIISVQLLEFKTNLLEAVEELHIFRDAEKRHEAQICQLVLDKQELEWQKESLEKQMNTMTNEHSEALAALKKQFQANMRGIEGEKGRHQLSAELKDKEIWSLKEELKSLQLFKYSLEKKLSELEQKLHLQTQARDSHVNQLGEVEKRFGMISRQCAVIKQSHEKLEQNVDEALRLNKKFVLINSSQESTIAALKEEVEKLNSKLVKGKVSSICKSGEESNYFLLKDQQLLELKQKLTVETDLNKKLGNENAVERAEKQELMSSLQHAQWLLQTQTQAVSRTEQQLLTHTEEYQAFKREHGIIRERSKEKEDRLLQLIEEYKHSSITLEKKVQTLQAKVQSDHKELKAVKVAYDNLHERHIQLSVNIVQQARQIHTEESGGSPQDSEQTRHHKEDKDSLDESTAGCHEAIIGGGNRKVNVGSQMVPEPLPSESLTSLAPDQTETSDSIGRVEVTNQEIDPAVKHEASVGKTSPVQNIPDNACSSSTLQMYTDRCLAELSESETRSVYGVTQPELCDRIEETSSFSEIPKPQTSDKHTLETAPTAAPETNSLSLSSSPNSKSKLYIEEQVAFEKYRSQMIQQEKAFQIPLKNQQTQQVIPEHLDLHQIDFSMSGADVFCDAPPKRHHKHTQLKNNSNPDQHNSLEDIKSNTDAMHANPLPEAENTISSPEESSPLCTFHLPEDLTENKSDDESTSAQMLTCHKNEHTYTGPQISKPLEARGPSSTDTPAKQSQQPNDTDASCCDDSMKYRSPSELTASPKEAAETQSGHEKSVPNVQIESLDNSPTLTRSSTSEQESPWPSDFQELHYSLHDPVFLRPRPPNRGSTVTVPPPDKLSVCSLHPKRKSDQGQWNAIKQTFSDIVSDHEHRVPISFGSARSGSPLECTVGNGPRQNCVFTPAPRIHACREQTVTSVEREEPRQSGIRAQIAKIDKFLSSEVLMLSKRRRMDGDVVKP